MQQQARVSVGTTVLLAAAIALLVGAGGACTAFGAANTSGSDAAAPLDGSSSDAPNNNNADASAKVCPPNTSCDGFDDRSIPMSSLWDAEEERAGLLEIAVNAGHQSANTLRASTSGSNQHYAHLTKALSKKSGAFDFRIKCWAKVSAKSGDRLAGPRLRVGDPPYTTAFYLNFGISDVSVSQVEAGGICETSATCETSQSLGKPLNATEWHKYELTAQVNSNKSTKPFGDLHLKIDDLDAGDAKVRFPMGRGADRSIEVGLTFAEGEVVGTLDIDELEFSFTER